MRLKALTFNINFKSGLKLQCEVVFPDGDLLEPAFYQGLIELGKVGTLLTEFENLVGNFIVGFLVVSLFEKFLLEFHQLFINAFLQT